MLYWPQSVKGLYLFLEGVLSFLVIFCICIIDLGFNLQLIRFILQKNIQSLFWDTEETCFLAKWKSPVIFSFILFSRHVWLISRKSLSKYPWELVEKVSYYIPAESVRQFALQSDAVPLKIKKTCYCPLSFLLETKMHVLATSHP